MRETNFLCPKENIFIKEIDKCKECEEAEECLPYQYEKEYIKEEQ